MGFDNDCILNIQSLAGEYFCPVCHLLVYPNEALQTQCTHLYCKPCLTYVCSTTHACPYDGYRVTEADSKPLLESNKALADTIGKIQVHCLYYRTGCTWQGPLSDCTSHCSTCAYGESPVLCNRCGIQIVHRQVQEHAQSCPGVQSQTQQQGGAHDTATSTGAGATSDQSQPAAQTGAAISQPQTSQTSAPPASQDANQPPNSAVQPQAAQPQAAQPQAAQAAVPTPEQWYQQQQQYQQQYQQYYQQYPGYDPYQQYYQQYPYQQQGTQVPQPQAYGQVQPQAYGQAQQQVQSHVQAQPQQQPQAPSQAVQPQSQPQTQPAVNVQPQVQSAGQGQSQMHAQSQGPPSHALPYNQSQPLPQAQATQPYAQPHPGPQQQMQWPQYQQTHSQMQQPHPQPYPQSQTQQYPYPQSQAQLQSQPHSQQIAQAPAHQPSQANQPINASAQLQSQNAVTGYQSYPQSQQHPQAQVAAAQQMHAAGAQQQPQYPGQMPGQFPSQASQVRPPQPYAALPSQQQPAMLSVQGQAPTGPPAQQLPAYPQAQQPGYPYQQRPGVQAAQQAAPQQYMQQQSFSGQGPYVQAQLHAQGLSQTQQQSQQNFVPQHGPQHNVAQNYPGRQMVPQGAVPQPYAQAGGLAGVGQVRPSQLNQTYPMRNNNQMSVASEQGTGHHQKSLKTADGENSRDQMLGKGLQDQDDRSKEARNMAGASSLESRVDETKKIKSENGLDEGADGNETKRDLSLASAGELPGSKIVENGVQEGKLRADGVSDPSSGGNGGKAGAEDVKKAEGQDLRHTDKGKVGVSGPASLLPQSHLAPQGHASNSFPSIENGRSQHHGNSAQQRPGVTSMPHPGNPQHPALMGHPPNQLRPQGLGQVPPGPPFNAADNSHPSNLKHLPGSSGPLGRSGNVGHYQGHVPPYQAGQPQNPHESYGGSSFAAQRPGVLDSHGMVGREPLPRPDVVEPRPPFPSEIEKFSGQRPGYFDGRLPDSHPHVPVERGPHGPAPPGIQPGTTKFNGPLAHDPMLAPGMRDERFKAFPEEHLKPFPHREFEDDLRKFPRPSYLEAGPSKFGTRFPSSGPLDQVHMFGVDGLSRPFEKGPHGFDRHSGLKMDSGVGSGPSKILPPFHPNDVGERARAVGFPDDNMGRKDFGRHPGPSFGRDHMDGVPPRSPGGDYAGFPSRTFGAFRDVDGNEPRSFEGPKPYSFPAEQFGKSIHDSRFPVPPSHLHRGELDVNGNFRMGDPHIQDMLPSHLRRGEHMGPRNLRLGDGAAFGPSGGLSRMGEPPLGRNFPQHLPFGESFAGEKPGHPLIGEPGIRGNYAFERYSRDGGFYPGEMEPFENPRKRMVGSIMCRICKVECGTVEGLDLHSQSREHQRKAMDMVLTIKQQNKKKQKTSNDQAPGQEGRDAKKPKTSHFGGRGNKR